MHYKPTGCREIYEQTEEYRICKNIKTKYRMRLNLELIKFWLFL